MKLCMIREDATGVRINYYDPSSDDRILKDCYTLASDYIHVSRDKDLLLYATYDNKVVGCVFNGISNIPSEWLEEDNARYTDDMMMYSFDIAVDDSFARLGAGPKLIKSAFRDFKDQSRMGPELVMVLEVVNNKLGNFLMRVYGMKPIDMETGTLIDDTSVYHPANAPYLSF